MTALGARVAFDLFTDCLPYSTHMARAPLPTGEVVDADIHRTHVNTPLLNSATLCWFSARLGSPAVRALRSFGRLTYSFLRKARTAAAKECGG